MIGPRRPFLASRMRGLGKDDSGASLMIALVMITVVALVVVAVLSFSFTSVRTTVALRDQAADQYTADGAAQVAINQLRRTDDINSICPTTGNGKFNYHGLGQAHGNTEAVSATVQCASDPNTGQGGDPTGANTSPGSALLTLAPVGSGETGVDLSLKGQTVQINGGIFSNSNISVYKGTLENVWPDSPSDSDIPSYTIARGGCTGSVITDSPPSDAPTSEKNCQTSVGADDWRGVDPGLLSPHGASYDLPTLPTSFATVSDCGSGKNKNLYQTVSPGKLTAQLLDKITGCTNGIVWFQPGTYYFNDTGNWSVGNMFILAGTPTNMSMLTSGRPSTVDAQIGSCVPPDDASATTTSGVELVFGGSSSLTVATSAGDGSDVVICASASESGPPVALYAPRSGETGLSQSVCLTQVKNRCALLDTTGNCPKCLLSINGTTYAPNNWFNMGLNNASETVFRWGLVVRSISFTTTGSPSLDAPLIDVPGTAQSPAPPQPSDMLLNVYTCAGAADCDTVISQLELVVKVRVSGTKPRTVSVLSWAAQR